MSAYDPFSSSVPPPGAPPPAFVPPESGAGIQFVAATPRLHHLASPGYRLGASLVDSGAGLLVVLVAAAVTSNGALTVLAALAFAFFDVAWLPARTDGQTLGKMLAGMRIVREDGAPFAISTGLVRDVLARLLFLIPFVALVDALMVFGAERKTLRDRIAGTRVVRTPVYAARQGVLTLAAIAAFVVAGAAGFVDASRNAPAADGYSAAERAQFVAGCERGGAGEALCGCTFDYLRAHVPHSAFASPADPRLRVAVLGAAQACGPAAGASS